MNLFGAIASRLGTMFCPIASINIHELGPPMAVSQRHQCPEPNGHKQRHGRSPTSMSIWQDQASATPALLLGGVQSEGV